MITYIIEKRNIIYIYILIYIYIYIYILINKINIENKIE